MESIHPYQEQIVFDISDMHAVEDYVLSRFQMYPQVYFHPVTSSMEIILSKLLKKIKINYLNNKLNDSFILKSLKQFLQNNWKLSDYLNLDDQLFNSYFNLLTKCNDPILSDLSNRFVNRKPFKSVIYDNNSLNNLKILKKQIENMGYNVNLYCDTSNVFDYPYSTNNEITFINHDQTKVKLSQISKLISTIANQPIDEKRFFFPKEIISSENDLLKSKKIYLIVLSVMDI